MIKAPLIRWQGFNMFTYCLLQVLHVVMLSFSGIICALQEKLVYIYCVEKRWSLHSSLQLVRHGWSYVVISMITLLLYWRNCTGSPWSRGLFLKSYCWLLNISDLLETYKPTRSLRLSSRNLLVIPCSTCKLKSYGNHAVSVSAPKLWNGIPEIIKIMSCRS